MNFFRQGYWFIVLVIAGGLWLLYAIREDANVYLKEGRVTVGRVLNYSSSIDNTQVSYAFYVNGKLIRKEGGTSQFYKKGQYVYVLYSKSDLEKCVILNNRKLSEGDTVLNVEIFRFNLSKQEIRDAVSGKTRKDSYR